MGQDDTFKQAYNSSTSSRAGVKATTATYCRKMYFFFKKGNLNI